MTDSTPIFDFTSYLTTVLSITPDDVDVHILSGGYTNLTARATFSRPLSLPTHFDYGDRVSSVVLKKSTPYMHAFPSYAAHPDRQAVEARALRILHGADPLFANVADVFARVPDLIVPQSVFHDVDQNILWMEDLGKGKTITEYILEDAPSGSTVEELAGALGQFVGGLHRATKNPTPETTSTLSDSLLVLRFLTSDAERVIREEAPEWRRDPVGIQLLIDRMYSVLDHESKLEPCLGMVDLWSANTLVTADEKFALVDWEYFGLSDPGCELGAFVADVHLCLFFGEARAEITTAVQSYVAKLASAYFEAFQDAVSPHFKRRFLITYGRSLILGPDYFAKTFDAASKARSVEAGLQCLRAAGPEDGTIDYGILESLPPKVVEGMMLFLEPAM